MRTCALCDFATESDAEFRTHQIEVHGFPRGGSIARTLGSCFAILLSLVGFGVIGLFLFGLAWSTSYSRAALQQITTLLVLAAVAFVGFDLVILVGLSTRWRHAVPAAAACFIAAVICIGLAATQ